ncbi:hypothetical protein N7495_001805 [Penicillium taxi]|uniref:uncharacterized protein n=1 Tax=Penicillium taxi TaxID=168475 RepID=UPI0025452213|nr:uncharacterized protein N7495_001805 [Penicillium taxi]KAJ5909123.1 hypothetical protein N7495_001805 [Penicillium taxi]
MEVPSQRLKRSRKSDSPLTQLGLQVPKARGAGRSGPRRRTGCLTCRARKVKCDETKPSCSNCDRLRISCVYKPPIALDGPWPSFRSKESAHATQSTSSPSPAASASTPASSSASISHRSQDLNFFGTVLRSDDQHRTIHASDAIRRLPADIVSYPPELGGQFDMLGFMGGITSGLEQKHLDLTSGLAGFATSSAQQFPAAGLATNSAEKAQFDTDGHSTLNPEGSSLVDVSIGSAGASASASDATTRGSWSDAGGTSHEEQLLQHFLAADPPAGIFAPVTIEWQYVRPAVMAHARDFAPLLNALYCYSDIRKATTEGKQWQWAPTYYRIANSGIQSCLLEDVSDSTLLNIFTTVFFLMLSELFSSPELCAPGTSYLHSGYLLLQRFHGRNRTWTGLGNLMVSWVLLLDVKSLIAGRDGDPLTELGNTPASAPAPGLIKPTDENGLGTSKTTDDLKDESNDDPFRSPSYLVYEAIVGPAFRFFVQAQQVVRRIVHIDLHHRSRGALSDEFEVLQIAHKVGADLETLWHSRPPVIDVYRQSDALTGMLNGPIADEICRAFRQYVASFLANFIYLHRVAFAIYPRTDRVNGAVDKIIQLAAVEFVSAAQGHLPVSFLWPLFIAGLEGSKEQRRWIIQQMQRMAESESTASRHPNAEKVILLLEEMTRRQDTSRTWADSRYVRRELFPDFFIII